MRETTCDRLMTIKDLVSYLPAEGEDLTLSFNLNVGIS